MFGRLFHLLVTTVFAPDQTHTFSLQLAICIVYNILDITWVVSRTVLSQCHINSERTTFKVDLSEVRI